MFKEVQLMDRTLQCGFYKFIKLENNKIMLLKYYGSETDVAIPQKIMHYTVSAIGSTTFRSNTRIKQIVIPPTVESIEALSFSECVNLRKINIPPLVDTIITHTFEDCINLETVIIENENCKIDEHAFLNSDPKLITVKTN